MTALAPAVPDAGHSTARVMVVWCPDWPVLAALAERQLPPQTPLAVVQRGQVYACSAAARAEGVRRGLRQRDAAARCPELVLIDHHPEHEVRAFEAVLATVEDVASTVSPIRPGLCALGVPSRFYGGAAEAAATLVERLVDIGVWDCRVGVADDVFAAEQAARLAGPQEVRQVPVSGSAAFLAGLPVSVLDDPELVSLLRRLGIRSLGDFAALSPRDVLTRFGQRGAGLHRLARGQDRRVAARRAPPLDIDARVSFDPPLETIEPIVFSSRRTAERLVADLAGHGLVCSVLQIEVLGERGWRGGRSWAHPRWFTAADLVDRIYWQLQGDPAPEPVHELRLVPEAVESVADHGEGLWGSAPDERVQRGVARLQGMLGPDAVVAASVRGGRTSTRRQVTTPWGERAPAGPDARLPWPGSIPPPAPARVFPEPRPATVLTVDGQPLRVTERGGITGAPVRFRPGPETDLVRVEAWAGPWPIEELWWDPVAARRVARFQVVGVDGSAWLLVVEDGSWWCEARYD